MTFLFDGHEFDVETFLLGDYYFISSIDCETEPLAAQTVYEQLRFKNFQDLDSLFISVFCRLSTYFPF